jgi:phenylpyruvate tautomerase PptA (4-oxalocrotonate tautomerase family)
MPMIDVYAAQGTFSDKHALAQSVAAAVMRWEQVPELALFKDNTAAFIHDLPGDSLSNVSGDSSYARVQVLTPAGVLDRDKQLGVVKELTEIVAAAAEDPSLVERTWVLITESPEGGWASTGTPAPAPTSPRRSRGDGAKRRPRVLAPMPAGGASRSEPKTMTSGRGNAQRRKRRSSDGCGPGIVVPSQSSQEQR